MNDEKNSAKSVMSLYDATRTGNYVGEASSINHLAWSLLTIVIGLILWLGVALINAENQRHALASKACRDRVFPAEIDYGCLNAIKSRAHWWQHVAYALAHPTR